MPVPRPPGVLPAPVVFDPVETVDARVLGYRFDLLDGRDVKYGELEGVKDGGSLDWSSFVAIQGSGTLTVDDTGQGIDWLNTRIRPVCLMSGTGVGDTAEKSLGVFLPSAPVETWDGVGRSWEIELLDKNSVLDQDIVTDDDGNPVTYSVEEGTDVIGAVRDLIESSGESSRAIEDGDKSLNNAMTFDLGATKLEIINELLAAGNFDSLWCDGQGQFRTAPTVDPRDLPPVYSSISPFSRGELSLMAPEWTRDNDIYSIPNRYVAISPGDGEEEAMVAVVTNEDPASPYSYPSRGRWITMVNSDVEAASEDDLYQRAVSGLASATAITSKFTIKHHYLPDLRVGTVVMFEATDGPFLCTVGKVSVPLDPVGWCESEIREVVL